MESDSIYYPSIGTPLRRADGVTASERMLQDIAEDTFFKLWCYAGLYNDEGIQKRKSGTELCDLLIVFGDHVVIFSDKSIQFNASIDVKVAWPRWYKRAVYESAKQAVGAESWIRRCPGRIYLEPRCETRFPIQLPPLSRMRVHKVLVTANSYLAAKRYFGGGSSGSFMLMPLLQGQEILDRPFQIGDVIPGKGVFHVLNEYTLALLLSELRTLPDFVRYLCIKEDLIQAKLLTIVSGEEELLAHYFRFGGFHRTDDICDKTRKLAATGGAEGIVLSEGLWDEFQTEPVYKQIAHRRELAKAWDHILDDMSSHISTGTALGPSRTVSDHERVLRFFCEEPMSSRAMLSVALLEKLDSVPTNHRSARLVPSPTREHLVFILVLFPQSDDQDYVDYRREREAVGQCYALVAKLLHPRFTVFALLLTEPQGATGSSRDFSVIEIEELTEAERVEASRLRDEERILSDVSDVTGLVLSDRLAKSRGQAFSVRQNMPALRNKVGRNALCPCGSSKKFKWCHGRDAA